MGIVLDVDVAKKHKFNFSLIMNCSGKADFNYWVQALDYIYFKDISECNMYSNYMFEQFEKFCDKYDLEVDYESYYGKKC